MILKANLLLLIFLITFQEFKNIRYIIEINYVHLL